VKVAPGHTPGSVCYLVAGRYLLSGDTLFKKSVGRPDLGGHVIEWSRDLFRTLHERIALLDESTLVLPAHYADISEIGADGVVSAKLGDLRRDLPELQISELAAFTEAMNRAYNELRRSAVVIMGAKTYDVHLHNGQENSEKP
jgi:glyoxylase-like metal-dependent hydrolase (beta-lactamase superfamily II)